MHTSGYVQRQIGQSMTLLYPNSVFRNDFFDVVGNTWLLYSLMVPDGIVLGVLIRAEVEDTFEVERIVHHVQVDPEQRLAVVVEDFAVEFFIISSLHSFGCLVQRSNT